MENPQKKTDELVSRLEEYRYAVDSLQVLAWEELRYLNADKDFLNEHRDIVRQGRLTKLEEVGYVLQLVGELNKDQSTEYTRRIEELEENKRLLEDNSKKLRQQINYTNDLLEEVVLENEELEKKLKTQGLSDKDVRKELKKAQLIETKDDTIQRLQTALANARREVDIIHRSRSPAPSVSEELKGTEIPPIVISAHNSGKKATEESGNEAGALEIVEELKTLITNARKAGNRGYTAETKAKKLSDLAQFEQKFNKLERVNRSLITEFNSLIPVAQEILERRAPSPRHQRDENQLRMPALSEIIKIVNNTVPSFFGTDGPDLSAEVFRYIQGCKMVERELVSNADNGLTQDIIQCLKLRLLGSAYSKISQLNFSSVDELCNTIKKFYLKRKSLDKIRELITGCKQSIREPASKFGERLENLLNEATAAIENEWPEGAGRTTMEADFKRITVRSFIKGLRDQTLKARFVGQEQEELSSLIKIVEDAEELFGEPTHALNAISLTEPCSFCNKQGHERISCRTRLNTPYCTNCGKYGHEMGPLCQQKPNQQVSCEYCKNRGHTSESCRKFLSSLYCRTCRVSGHRENAFCNRQVRRNSAGHDQWNNRPPGHNRSPPVRELYRRDNINTRAPRPNATNPRGTTNSVCFKCNQPGHFARECPNIQTPSRNTGQGGYANATNNNRNRTNYQEDRKNNKHPVNDQGNGFRPSYSQ